MLDKQWIWKDWKILFILYSKKKTMNKVMNTSKGTYTKEFKKIVYKYSNYNEFWYDSLIDDLEYLLDIKWVDFIWWNKNTRNYNNILGNYLYDSSIDVTLDSNTLKIIYDEFIYELENDEWLSKYIDKLSFEKFSKITDDIEVDLNLDEYDLWDRRIWYLIEDVNEIINNLNVFDEDDIENVEDILDSAIDSKQDDIYWSILDKYDIMDIGATWYSQSDWEEYVIFVNKKDIKKIEKAIWIKYKDWKKQIEFNLEHLFTVADIDVSAVYGYTYFDKNWNEIERENKEEYMTNVILYWNETRREEEEIIREKVNDYWDIKINENTIIEHEQ